MSSPTQGGNASGDAFGASIPLPVRCGYTLFGPSRSCKQSISRGPPAAGVGRVKFRITDAREADEIEFASFEIRHSLSL